MNNEQEIMKLNTYCYHPVARGGAALVQLCAQAETMSTACKVLKVEMKLHVLVSLNLFTFHLPPDSTALHLAPSYRQGRQSC